MFKRMSFEKETSIDPLPSKRARCKESGRGCAQNFPLRRLRIMLTAVKRVVW